MLGKDLQKIFERIQPGFSYELLALEIDIQTSDAQNKPKIQCITRLIQLYMAAVQALQSKCDKRYKYFNLKIQNLMKKKYVVQQLHIASTGRSADKTALQEVYKAQIGERKNQLDLQIFLNKQQFDAKKIREMMKTSDNKLRKFEKNIQKNIKQQDDQLQQRRRLRKLKSDAGSVTKFDFDRRFKSPNSKFVMKSQQQLDDYFAIDKKQKKQIRKRSGSIEKIETQISLNNKISASNNMANKLKALVV